MHPNNELSWQDWTLIVTAILSFVNAVRIADIRNALSKNPKPTKVKASVSAG